MYTIRVGELECFGPVLVKEGNRNKERGGQQERGTGGGADEERIDRNRDRGGEEHWRTERG